MILLTLIIAHLIADFYCQTDEMVKDKKKYLKRHLIHHSVVTFVGLLILFVLNNSLNNILSQVVLPTACIVLVHFIIDSIKIKATNNVKEKYNVKSWNLVLFIVDQILHFLSILIVCHFVFDINISTLITKMLILLHLVPGNKPIISPINIVMFFVVIVIISTTVSGHIIRLLLGTLPNHLALFEGKYTLKDVLNKEGVLKTDNAQASISEEYSYMVIKEQSFSRGKIIGYVERILVIVLVFQNQYAAIGFILAAKSLARFKQMDDRDWAEYFLLGTLVSILLGIIYGITISLVLK
ncbi:hypothetical protein CON78_29970 [Bacillus toyonensis]|uniref:DUF3307 domain-containing protein n=1 Tax=Bacillus toyonensis TaxID=155322 RepID=UPI000BEBECA4|nr:DUF3307 domain-containing protein [Bacillus toyonensis]MCG3795978.1 DUF3307 domain-containing protein [Bacillus toyonensis]PED94589.1 hypothetical protein CON78_29970 [Bacillus toyonensis]